MSAALGPDAVTERAAENQRYVREQIMRRESALAQVLGGLLRDRNEHVRECPQREPRQQRGRGSR